MLSLATPNLLPAPTWRDDDRLARTLPLTLLMAAALLVVIGLGYWDARRESEDALVDLSREHSTLAKGVAAAISGRLSRAESPPSEQDLLAEVRGIEKPDRLRLFLSRPGASGLVTTAGGVVRDAAVERALREGAEWALVQRAEAPAFGLPRRTAVAGLATFDGPGGRWGVVAAATAMHERDRGARAQWRSVAGVVIAAALILLFGGFAMQNQRKELTLSRELAVSELTRQREEQIVRIDKLATLAALSTGIAHEVSTPLGVIVGRAEQLLPKVANDERATKGVQAIIEQGTRIDRVVRGFLALARGESSSVEPVQPATIARAAAELVAHRFEQASVHLRLQAEDGLPLLSADPQLLEQVLINLLSNACDACSRDGMVELSVTANGERVTFMVVDDGAGITEDAIARVTEPFFTTKPAGKGTGLGLAIANEIVKHFGGGLVIEPRNAGRGTRAIVDFPISRGVT